MTTRHEQPVGASAWERLGGAYGLEWERPAKRVLSARELDFVTRHLERTPRRAALDVGIGSGRILAELLSRTTDMHVYGVDIAQAMVGECDKRFAGEDRIRGLYVCDVSREDVPINERFDLISAVRVLKYSANWPEIVGKLVSLLHPGGILVFTMPNDRSLTQYTRRLAWLKRTDPTFRIPGRWTVPSHATSEPEIDELCGRLGTSVLEMTGFTKLPHFFYNRPSRPRAADAVVRVDRALDNLVGEVAFTRELFVAVQALEEPRVPSVS